MSQPGEIQFQCVGCGAMNPAGAEVCAGCGHRFGWQGMQISKQSEKVDPPPAPQPSQRFPDFSLSDEVPSPVRKPLSTTQPAHPFFKFLATLLLMFLFTAMLVLVVALAGVILLGIVCGLGKDGSVAGMGFGLIVIGAIVVALIRVLLKFLNN